jgi:hypothetical protein
VTARRRRGAGPSRWIVAVAFAAAMPARSATGQEFFRTTDVLPVTLRTDLGALRRDRDTATAEWRQATLTYAGRDSAVTVPVRVRTRGIFRLKTCDFPPIRLRFSEGDVRGTLLDSLRRPKLVTHCMDRGGYEQYLLQEYAIYRVLRLFTPMSFSARLLRVTYEDAAGAARPLTRYAFVTEDPERLAERLGGTFMTQQGARFGMIDRRHAALVGLFQYFIANTDWSVPGLHNIVLLRARDTTYAVPFDFDWSGVIAPPYARPAPSLPIRSVRERIYRGFCQAAGDLEPVLAQFEALRDSIAAVYRAIPDLDPRTVERTLRYYDEFYRAVADRAQFVRRVVEPDCLP